MLEFEHRAQRSAVDRVMDAPNLVDDHGRHRLEHFRNLAGDVDRVLDAAVRSAAARRRSQGRFAASLGLGTTLAAKQSIDSAMHVDVFPRLSPEELVRRWQALLQDPEAPERFELDEYGDVLVTPTPSFWHQHTTARIGRLLEAQLGGEAGSYALRLSIGVRMPDVCWAPGFLDLARLGSADPLDHMPPLCVEVVSAGNKRKDVAEKVPAYLAAGVQEVIVIDEGKAPRFFTLAGDSERRMFGVTISL